MSYPPQSEISENDLEALRRAPDAIAVITALLGTREMAPADQIRTEEEVREYVRLAQPQEAHALIHNSKSRRESWEREQALKETPVVD